MERRYFLEAPLGWTAVHADTAKPGPAHDLTDPETYPLWSSAGVAESRAKQADPECKRLIYTVTPIDGQPDHYQVAYYMEGDHLTRILQELGQTLPAEDANGILRIQRDRRGFPIPMDERREIVARLRADYGREFGFRMRPSDRPDPFIQAWDHLQALVSAP